jgi:hypothetical protein
LPSKTSQLGWSPGDIHPRGAGQGVRCVVLGGSEEVAEGKGELGGGDSGRPNPRAGVRCGARSRAVPIGSPPASVPGRSTGSELMRYRAWLSSPTSSRCGLRRAQLRSRYEITCPSIGISLRLLMPFPEILRSSYSLTTAYPPVEEPRSALTRSRDSSRPLSSDIRRDLLGRRWLWLAGFPLQKRAPRERGNFWRAIHPPSG